MNDKLKLPLTAVFSFVLGGVVFFPWGAQDEINIFRAYDLETASGFDSSLNIAAKVKVKKAEYIFSISDLKLSNLAIKNQLKNTDFVVSSSASPQENKTIREQFVAKSLESVTPMVRAVRVDYQFAEDELQVSNLAIKKQLKSSIVITNIKPFHENEVEVAESNQLENVISIDRKANEETDISLSDRLNTTENVIPENNTIEKINYQFSSDELEISNLTIQKQLARYLDMNENDEIKQERKINNDEFELSEESETDEFVKGVSDYFNKNDNTVNLYEDEYLEFDFSESELLISNLAIKKQLRGYTSATNLNEETSESISELDSELNQVVTITPSSQGNNSIVTKSNVENESELLISNSAHDDDDYSSIPVKHDTEKKFRKRTQLSIKEDVAHDEAAEQEEEEEDDDDEYGSERVVFSNEPLYFTDSFEKKSIVTIEKNIEVPGVEDIQVNSISDNITDSTLTDIENIEMIEEIEISDDGNIITSSAE